MNIHLIREINVIVSENMNINAHMRDVIGRWDLFFGQLLKSIVSAQNIRAVFLDTCLENFNLSYHHGAFFNLKLVAYRR